MTIIIAVIVIVVVIILIAAKNSDSTPAPTVDAPTTEESSDAPVYAKYLRFKIAGLNHRRGIADYLGKFRGELVPEPTNKHDKNAIAILCDGKRVGYIPADETDEVRALGMEFPIVVYCEIFDEYDEDDEGNERRYFWGTADIELPE
jgi:hypothetical protein